MHSYRSTIVTMRRCQGRSSSWLPQSVEKLSELPLSGDQWRECLMMAGLLKSTESARTARETPIHSCTERCAGLRGH